LVVIDTDVLLLAFAFHNDSRQAANTEFLTQVQTADPAITVYNLMELLGQFSFNLTPARLDTWQSWLLDAYQLTVIWPSEPDERISASSFFRSEVIDRPLAKIRSQRMAFLDALVLGLAERTPEANNFVTWNAKHFKGKSSLKVLTPTEYLRQ